jgi:hypothetical protein
MAKFLYGGYKALLKVIAVHFFVDAGLHFCKFFTPSSNIFSIFACVSMGHKAPPMQHCVILRSAVLFYRLNNQPAYLRLVSCNFG